MTFLVSICKMAGLLYIPKVIDGCKWYQMTILLPIRKECLPSNLGVDGCKWSQMTFKMFVNTGGGGGWWPPQVVVNDCK